MIFNVIVVLFYCKISEIKFQCGYVKNKTAIFVKQELKWKIKVRRVFLFNRETGLHPKTALKLVAANM